MASSINLIKKDLSFHFAFLLENLKMHTLAFVKQMIKSRRKIITVPVCVLNKNCLQNFPLFLQNKNVR